jgi:dTDP-4-dehydrorhamnose reductase
MASLSVNEPSQKRGKTESRILITGGSGFLGQHLLHYIACQSGFGKFKVTYTYCTTQLRASSGTEAEADESTLTAEAVHMDLTDKLSIAQALQKIMPDVIIHTAACSSPAFCAKNPDKAMSINAPTELLKCIDELYNETAKKSNRPLIIYLSTDQVYEGIESEAPYQIVTKPVPVNVYGVSKLGFENLLTSSCEPRNFVVLRSSNMVGPPSPYTKITKFLQWLENNLAQDKEIDLFDDEVRSYLHVHDVCEIIWRILQKWTDQDPICTEWIETGKVYNMGGPEAFSRVGMALVLAEQSPDKYSTLLSNGEAKIKASKRGELNQQLGYVSPMNISMNSSQIEGDLSFKFRSLRGHL